MTEEEAIAFVEARRGQLSIEDDMEFASAERAIVRYKADPSVPGPVEDRIAWIIKLENATSFVEVHVDDARRQILNVRRSS